jgi:archaellin
VPLKIMSIAVSGTNPSQYKRTHTCGYSVPPGASCEIKVIFKPTSTGSKPAKLVITAGTAAGAREVSLSGTGVSWTYSLSTSSLAFGTVTRNTTSVAKTVRISNTSIVALPISSISLGGTNPTQFAFTKTCSSTLAAGASCTVSAVFKPTSTGAKSATLKVTPGGGAAAKTVALSGTGK